MAISAFDNANESIKHALKAGPDPIDFSIASATNEAYLFHMILDAIPAALRLNPRDKRQLAEELWNVADQEEGEVSVDASILALLEQRLAAHAGQPQAGSTWDDVKQRVFGGHGA